MNSKRLVLAHLYLDAKELVIAAGYADEVEWQHQLLETEPTESDFLRECAWVILSTGMHEAVVRTKFPGVSAAFLEWQGAADILARSNECRIGALATFAHTGKIDAIIAAAKFADEAGMGVIRDALSERDLPRLTAIPYIGPVTAHHLAKNLGVDTAKPDRHVSRVANELGYSSARDLCLAISQATADPVAVVDIVLWRWAKLRISRDTNSVGWTSAGLGSIAADARRRPHPRA